MVWNEDFTARGNPAWNSGFDKKVPDGAPGNQAQKGIFFEDGRGRIQRLTEAEGHEIGYNPESVERNPIGQEAPSTEIRSYNLTIDKDIIVKKGAPNFEYFDMLMKMRPTGNNAKQRIYLVDFRREEVGDSHNRYYAETMMATITINSINETDGTLSVNFAQDGDYAVGVMERTDGIDTDDESFFTYGFTPSRLIPVAEITTSIGEVEIPVGGTARAAVSFSPLGCPYDFSVKSSDESKVVVRRWNQSVDIKGRGAGTATVTITSADNPAITAEIEVTVI